MKTMEIALLFIDERLINSTNKWNETIGMEWNGMKKEEKQENAYVYMIERERERETRPTSMKEDLK